MTIIALLAFGLVLLALALIFRKRHTNGYDQIMQHNRNVQPLFKERSATIKHDQLMEQFKGDPKILRELIDLQTDFADKLMTAELYERKLDELKARYAGTPSIK